MSERYVVDLPISAVSADVAGAPASMIEHYVRCVGRPESSSLTSFAVSPLSDGDGWQPIETARHDASLILAVPAKDGGFIVGEAAWFEGEEHETGWWWAGSSPGDYYSSSIAEGNFHQPTHWRSLPEAPK